MAYLYQVIVRSQHGDEPVSRHTRLDEATRACASMQASIVRPGFRALVVPVEEEKKEVKRMASNKNTALLEALEIEIEECHDRLNRLNKMRELYLKDQEPEAPKAPRKRRNGVSENPVTEGSDGAPSDGQ